MFKVNNDIETFKTQLSAVTVLVNAKITEES